MSNNIDKVVELAEEIKKEKVDEIVLSTGVVLKAKRVSSVLFAELARKFKEPEPPMWFNKENDREEENPNDPAYLRAKERYTTELGLAVLNAVILFGTCIVSIPKDIDALDSDGWKQKLLISGIDIGDTKDHEYIAWIKYIATTGEDDYNKIETAVAGISNVLEDDVSNASPIFRDNEG
jgi:hypothetical protein